MASQVDPFEQFLVKEYLRLGSINKVFSNHQFNLPISFAGYTRVLSKYGVIKSAGPNSNLSESLQILSILANYKIPLERVYHRLAPSQIQVSTNTLHRILHYTRLGLTRRQGTALIITNSKYPDLILTGKDQSLSNSKLGHKGDFSLPMGHSKVGESPRNSILRVLQQEVFANHVINLNFPYKLLPNHPKPIMFVNIADIRVAVYHLAIDQTKNFSSFKLSDIQFRDPKKMPQNQLRPGIKEIIDKYFVTSLDIDKQTINNSIPEFSCALNYSLSRIYPKR